MYSSLGTRDGLNCPCRAGVSHDTWFGQARLQSSVIFFLSIVCHPPPLVLCCHDRRPASSSATLLRRNIRNAAGHVERLQQRVVIFCHASECEMFMLSFQMQHVMNFSFRHDIYTEMCMLKWVSMTYMLLHTYIPAEREHGTNEHEIYAEQSGLT